MISKKPRGRRVASVSTAAVLALSLLVAACGDDEGDETGSTPPSDLELVIEGPDQTVTLVDNPARRVAPPDSELDESRETPGDMAVQQAPVRDESGEEVGQNYAVFTTVGEPGTELVTGTTTLEGGQIFEQGIIGKGAEDELAIVGGTGDYADVRGTVRVTQDAETVTLLFDFVG